MSYGMFITVYFGKPQEIDEVFLDSAPEPESKVQVEVLDSHSRWVPLTDTCQPEPLDTPSGIRRAATLALKQRGIGYLLVRDTDFFAADMRRYASYWGVTELKRIGQTSLYHID